MNNNSRQNALSWPYPRHSVFEAQLRKSNADWFAEKHYRVNLRKPYILEREEDWPKNIILPEVVQFIRAEQQHRVQAKKVSLSISIFIMA